MELLIGAGAGRGAAKAELSTRFRLPTSDLTASSSRASACGSTAPRRFPERVLVTVALPGHDADLAVVAVALVNSLSSARPVLLCT